MYVRESTLCCTYSSLLDEKISDEKQKIDHIKQQHKEVLKFVHHVF